VIPRGPNDDGVSGAIGTIFLIIIVVVGMSILMVAVISQPQPQKIPAMTAEVINTSTALYLKHDGGDTLQKGEFQILVDGQDKTAAFGDPATWSIGQTLTYSGYDPQNMPGTIQIVYTGGRYGQTIEQIWVKPPTVGTSQTSTVSPTTSATTTTTTTTTTTGTPTPVPAPVANFTATPSSGNVPLTVTFTDTSTNSPTSWNWVFGDIGSGNTSASQNPSHTYTAAGTYSAKLTATNAGGSSATSRQITVTTPPAPIASFTASPTSGAPPLTVTFTDTSTNSPTSWNWVFGDVGAGNTSTSQNPSHTYTAAGTYSAKLTATNAGGSTSATQQITINPAPTITSISPITAKHGVKAVSVIITGTGFQTYGTTGVIMVDNATQTITITGSSVSVTNSNQVTCLFNMPDKSNTGIYDVKITNPDGQTGSLASGFTVS
jgi:PKD repeat protein